MSILKGYTTFLVCYALTPLFSLGMCTAKDQLLYNSWFLLAASEGDNQSAAKYLDNGVSINCMNKEGRTALWLAAEAGNRDMVDLLLKRMATVDPIDVDGWSPLHIAVFRNRPIIVQQLINARAKVDLPDADGKTPLAKAAKEGYVHIVSMLLVAGADHVIRDCFDNTALSYAITRDHAPIVALLKDMRKVDFNSCMPDGWLPIVLAAFEGNSSVMRLLLQEGAQVDAYKKDGSSALAMAAQYDKLRCVKILLDHDAQVDICLQGTTPLWRAACNGHAEVVEVLLQAGASPAHQNLEGVSVMHIAQAKGYRNIVEMLEKNMSKPKESTSDVQEVL